MIDLWDYTGDAVVKGDCLRECYPVSDRTEYVSLPGSLPGCLDVMEILALVKFLQR